MGRCVDCLVVVALLKQLDRMLIQTANLLSSVIERERHLQFPFASRCQRKSIWVTSTVVSGVGTSLLLYLSKQLSTSPRRTSCRRQARRELLSVFAVVVVHVHLSLKLVLTSDARLDVGVVS